MPTIRELTSERAKILHDARAIIDFAECRNRALTGEEGATYDRLTSRAAEIRDQLSALASDLDGVSRQRDLRAAPIGQPANAVLGFRRWLQDGGLHGSTGEAFRALSMGTDASGGYMVAPETFLARLISGLDATVFVRNLATIVDFGGAQVLGVPAVDADMADPDWTEEPSVGGTDSALTLGKRRFRPWTLRKLIKVSRTLANRSGGFAESVVADRFVVKFGIALEKAYLTGDGVKKPLGVFTASDQGVPTSQDVTTDNTSTTVTGDGLMNARFGLKSQFQVNAQWVFHREVMKQIAKLKDSNGDYLVSFAEQPGQLDTLLGKPVNLSEFAPSTMVSGAYVGLIGDFNHYWIADSMQLALMRLEELYSETAQLGFIGAYDGDGMPASAEAFVRVKLG